MTDSGSPRERIDFSRADDPRDVVHRAVAELAQGGCLGVAGSRGVRLAALSLHPQAVATLEQDAAPGDFNPRSAPVVLLRGVEEAADWVPNLRPLGARLLRRAWPGPVVFVVESGVEEGLLGRLDPAVRSLFGDPARLALNLPESPFLREVVRLLPGPLILRSIAPSALDGDRLGPCRLLIDEPLSCGSDDTWVQLEAQGWNVLVEGSVEASAFTRMAATTILFVCTGNTCRSPMAEALCKVLLAERLGCTIDALPERGFVVASAGIAAIAGMPAAGNALDVVRSRGGSLQGHVSRRLTLNDLVAADHILAMTSDHLETLRDHAPDSCSRARLLHPEGDDVADPVGSDRPTYQRTAEAIESYLERFLDSILDRSN